MTTKKRKQKTYWLAVNLTGSEVKALRSVMLSWACQNESEAAKVAIRCFLAQTEEKKAEPPSSSLRAIVRQEVARLLPDIAVGVWRLQERAGDRK